MVEVWKDIVGYEGLYQVSNFGRVKSLKTEIILKPQKRNHGYLSVCLYGKSSKKGKFKQFSVHRLVAIAFIPNPNNYTEVNHLDENKQNNVVTNLEWCTHKQNSNYGTKNARQSKASTNGKRSKAVIQYTKDGQIVRVFPSIAEADRNGFSRANVCKCAQGNKSYSHAYGYVWRYAN